MFGLRDVTDLCNLGLPGFCLFSLLLVHLLLSSSCVNGKSSTLVFRWTRCGLGNLSFSYRCRIGWSVLDRIYYHSSSGVILVRDLVCLWWYNVVVSSPGRQCPGWPCDWHQLRSFSHLIFNLIFSHKGYKGKYPRFPTLYRQRFNVFCRGWF